MSDATSKADRSDMSQPEINRTGGKVLIGRGRQKSLPATDKTCITQPLGPCCPMSIAHP